MADLERLEFTPLDQDDIKRRLFFSIHATPKFEIEDGVVGSEWIRVIDYNYPINTDIHHKSIVLHDVLVHKNNRFLPLNAIQVQEPNNRGRDTWYYYPFPDPRLKTDTERVAQMLCDGVSLLEAQDLVRVDFIYEKFA